MLIINGYIISLPKDELTLPIKMALDNRPSNAPSGHAYKLRTDTLEWELVELPTMPEEEATVEDYEAALAELGVK